jgi:hypothetical protein
MLSACSGPLLLRISRNLETYFVTRPAAPISSEGVSAVPADVVLGRPRILLAGAEDAVGGPYPFPNQDPIIFPLTHEAFLEGPGA